MTLVTDYIINEKSVDVVRKMERKMRKYLMRACIFYRNMLKYNSCLCKKKSDGPLAPNRRVLRTSKIKEVTQ